MKIRLGTWSLKLAAWSLLLAGCATVGPREGAPCLPPGVTAEMLAWPVVEVRPLLARGEGGALVPLYQVRHQREDRGVAMYWSQGRLIAADPSPDSEAPPWINEEWTRGDGTIFAEPRGGCRWRQTGERGA